MRVTEETNRGLVELLQCSFHLASDPLVHAPEAMLGCQGLQIDLLSLLYRMLPLVLWVCHANKGVTPEQLEEAIKTLFCECATITHRQGQRL